MIDKPTFAQSNRGPCFKPVCKAKRKTGKEKDKPTDRQTDWLTDRQTSRQSDRYTGGNPVTDIERDR